MNHNVDPTLIPFLVPIEALHHDSANARDHPEENIDAIKASLLEFKQRKLIAANKAGKVVAGNGLLMAAKALGWTHVAAAMQEYRDAVEETRFGISDNQASDLSKFNDKVLSKLLAESAVSKDLPGFSEERLKALLEGVSVPERKTYSVEELANIRETTGIRQIVLVMDIPLYEQTLDDLKLVMARTGTDTNTAAIVRLLKDWKGLHA